MKWEKGTVFDLCDINPENIPRNYPHDYIRYFDITSVGSGVVTTNDEIPLNEAPSRAKRVVRSNDTILATVRPGNRSFYYFKTAFENSIASTGFAVLRPKAEKADPRFLYYLVTDPLFTAYLVAYEQGANYPAVNPDIIGSKPIAYPPLPTQRKIASILAGYDDLIENNLKRIKLLEEAINLNYKALISNEDKDVTIVKLNSFVDIISGYPFKSNYYNEIGKHKIVTIKNVQDGFFVPIVTDRIEDIPDNMNRALFLSTGDVIMSLTGNVGRVCLVHGDDYVLNQRVVKLSAKELIDQSFIYALVRDKQMLEILENLSNGTAQQNLSPIKMGDLPIRYPNSNLREDFNKKVSTMIEMICKLNIQNTKLREARDILLPKLMNGQIEV